jgi:hypothetical protein
MECGLSSAPTTQDCDRPTDLRQQYDTREQAARQLEWRDSNKFLTAFLLNLQAFQPLCEPKFKLKVGFAVQDAVNFTVLL